MPPLDVRSWLLAGIILASAGNAPAAAQVWGTVVDSAGRPVRRVMVDLTGPGFMRRSGTDGQGQFVIWDAPPGRTLSVQAIDDRGRFSLRRSIVPPDTAPPLVFPANRESRGLRIDSAQVTRDMRQRDPAQRGFGCVGQQCSMSYLTDVGQVYCWTLVTGTAVPRTIRHVWYWEEREMARVAQVVRGPTWRTWSSKRIDPSWNGRWRVDILADDGTLLISRYFQIDSDRDTVRTNELRRVAGRSVYDALFYLRPRWFLWRPTPAADIVEPRVYVDGAFKGQGWLATHDVPLTGVQAVRRVMTEEARRRWGPEIGDGWALDIRTGR